MAGQVKAVLAVGDSRHGTTNGYNKYGCRCDSCRVAATDSVRKWKQKVQGSTPPRHGVSGYGNWGCRCGQCRAAWAAAARRRRVERGHSSV